MFEVWLRFKRRVAVVDDNDMSKCMKSSESVEFSKNSYSWEILYVGSI